MKHLFITFVILFTGYSLEAQSNTLYKWQSIDNSFDSIATICEEAMYHDYPRKRYSKEIEQMHHIAHQKNNKQLLARANYWKAWKEMKINIDSAATSLSQGFATADSILYPYDHARLRFLEGDIYRIKGKWSEAYRIYKQQEKFFTHQNDIFYIAKTEVAIGVILQELGETEGALRYFQQGERLFERIGNLNCAIKNRINLSNVMYLMGDKEDALAILHELEKSPVTQQDTVYMINVLSSTFSVSDKSDHQCSQRAYELAKLLQDKQLYTITQLIQGESMRQQQLNDSALYYFRLALHSAIENNEVYRKPSIFKGISDTYSALHRPDSAFHYMKLAESFRDSLLNHEKIIELNKLESRATIEKYEAEIKQAEEKAIYQKRLTWILVISLTLLSGLICYIMLLARRRAEISKQLKEAENKELSLLNEQYLIEIDSKNRELTSNTLIIAKKNAILKELSDQIEALENSGSIGDKDSDQLKSHIKTQMLADDEWQYFKLHFEKVHPNFFVTLKELYPNLSETELRLCAYIRIGMSAKEIAQMLSIQPETVNTSRYRIRKKIKLATGESLENYLRAL